MREDDVITGPVRNPRNLSAHATGSIHDDATASALGFRGGTVAGSIHMDQFPPLLLAAFGPRWFETGSLSLYFRHATTDGEPVRALLGRPKADDGDAQVRAWATTTDDVLVADGTAAVGGLDETSALYSRDLRAVDPAELRILKALRAGDVLGDCRSAADGARQRAVIERGAMTEPLDWYTAASPWGGPIAAPSAVVNLLYADLLRGMRESMGEHVGLFGAIEIRFRAGPVFLDSAYRVTGEVVALSQTPKTEVLWFDSRALDDDGTLIAEMRMMLRQMKQSSPLYAQ
jgi:limonene-1,2-epoxide hydrolase